MVSLSKLKLLNKSYYKSIISTHSMFDALIQQINVFYPEAPITITKKSSLSIR